MRKLNLKEEFKTPIVLFAGCNEETILKVKNVVGKIPVYNCSDEFPKDVLQIGVDDADCIIFACPEWNGAYPWMLKKVIDSLKYKTFKGKTMKMIVWSGGDNKAESLRYSLVHLAHFLQMNISHEYLYLEV